MTGGGTRGMTEWGAATKGTQTLATRFPSPPPSPAGSPPNNRKGSVLIAAIGIKRLGLGVAALAAAIFAGLVILSLLIPADTVRDSIKAEIRAVTGLDPVLGGDVAVSLFPNSTVVFDQVALGDNRGGEPAMTVEQLVVRLRFFPLLIGRIEIADVSLVRPTITIAFLPDGS